MTVEEVTDKYKHIQYFTGPMKSDITDILVNQLQPIREKYNALIDDREYLEKVLVEGSEEAANIAKDTINEVYVKAGCVDRKLSHCL